MSYLIDASRSAGGTLTPDDIAQFILMLQEKEFDAHVPFMGQNGIGKSLAAFAVNKATGGFDIRKDVIYPFNTTPEAIRAITQQKNKHLQFDELGHFFPYKLNMTLEQITLFNSIEIARANRNSITGCCRDILRINNNYRNGKAQALVWLLARDGEGTMGVVLLGNPLFETEDKFMVSMVRPSFDLDDICAQIEQLPTFIGYIFFDHYSKYITRSELDYYVKQKELGMRKAAEMHQARLQAKEMRERALLRKGYGAAYAPGQRNLEGDTNDQY